MEEEKEEVGTIAENEADVCKVPSDNTKTIEENHRQCGELKLQGGRKVNDGDDIVWIRWLW